MTETIQSLAKLDPVWIYTVIFLISYIENIFPPSPSDVVVVFGGALAGLGHGNYLVALVCGTIGSTLGFMTMYAIGRWFGAHIVETGRIKFIPFARIRKAEDWFARYGNLIIIANRFLAGTRAVISFFAGMSKLDISKTTLLSFVSSLAWYGILVYAGYSLGNHWQRIEGYLVTYSQVAVGAMLVLGISLIVRSFFLKKSGKSEND